MKTKICGRCKLSKAMAEFNRKQSYCLPCARLYDKEYRAKNPEKIQAYREAHRDQQRARDKVRARPKTLAQYGLTIESFEVMRLAQDGRCLICLKVPQDILVVDHDHRTNTVRGLLCRICNAAIGQLGDSPERLIRAASYLLEYAPVTADEIAALDKMITT